MMAAKADLERIDELLSQVPRAPGQRLPSGLTDEVISGFEERVGFPMPPEQANLLRLSNGPCVGPGGIFGVRPALAFLDIEQLYESYPGWRDQGWVPVASDGCGNYYVAARAGKHWPIVFIDTVEDADQAAFIVASGVLKFVIALLEKELGETGWPFNEAKVTASDPSIIGLGDTFTLPWDS
jgi:hypothetical protein